MEKITLGLQARAAASRGAAGSFLLFLARLPSCLCGSSVGAVGFQAVCSFQAPSLQLPSYRAAQTELSDRDGD